MAEQFLWWSEGQDQGEETESNDSHFEVCKAMPLERPLTERIQEH